MDTVSISDAAYTGFRIVRERPRAAIVWVGVQLVASIVFGGALIAMAGPALMQLQSLSASTPKDPSQALSLLQQLAPAYGLLFIFGLVFNSLLYGAMNRAVMRPTEDRFGYFRLGADELRQFALMLLTFVVMVGVYFVAIFVAIVIGVIVALLFKSAAGLAGVLAGLAAVCAMVFVLIRLSLASAQTFDTGKVNLFGSWALTRGRFWAIFGTYVLVFALAAVVGVLGFVVTFAFMAVLGGKDAMAAMMHPDLSSLAAMVSPARLAQIEVNAVITALIWPVVFTPPAAIYLRLTAAAAPADRP